MPPNSTSVVQPMDQCNALRHSRYFIYRLIQSLENKEPFNVTILEDIKLIAQSWNEVTSTTTSNCFRYEGLIKSADEFDSDDGLPLVQWLEKYKKY